MEDYKFTYEDKTYELGEDNLDYFLNDEEKPVSGIDLAKIMTLLNEAEDVSFSLEYYDSPCDNCLKGKAEKEKYFKFLEYHFFLYTKEATYVTSNIDKGRKEYFTSLLNKGLVDDSYIVSIMVCQNCGNYAIEIEQCEV
ncbi:DUF3785 family protein [Clostridium thermarum]|uniref:DUF3785 family protein n=1 Tax=Clostridium thermarum TaxID=1716543 RepID=UPI0013D21934|nr:DUF3785 family protein [Clostridium thermarum]